MISTFVYKLFSHLPLLEVAFRHFYWLVLRGANFRFLKNFKKGSTKVAIFDFGDIVDHLRTSGIEFGKTMVVHSSYDKLIHSGLRPKQINDALFALVGKDGNVVMPVNRQFASDYRSRMRESIDTIDTFDPCLTRVTTGALGYALLKNPESSTSLHPVSNAVVIGAMSEWFVSDNISGNLPKPCGTGSVWSKCLDVDAFIIGLGTDLVHSLTMTHIVEDLFFDNWPIKCWYNRRTFRINLGTDNFTKTVLERKPVWGKLYYAEAGFRKDLLKNGILNHAVVSGITVEIIQTKALIDFLLSKNKDGYPFRFLPKKFFKQ